VVCCVLSHPVCNVFFQSCCCWHVLTKNNVVMVCFIVFL
jgi:hypothetical protein